MLCESSTNAKRTRTRVIWPPQGYSDYVMWAYNWLSLSITNKEDVIWITCKNCEECPSSCVVCINLRMDDQCRNCRVHPSHLLCSELWSSNSNFRLQLQASLFYSSSSNIYKFLAPAPKRFGPLKTKTHCIICATHLPHKLFLWKQNPNFGLWLQKCQISNCMGGSLPSPPSDPLYLFIGIINN